MSVKLRISQKPKIAPTFFPFIKGSISPPLSVMLRTIISVPASPNPNANNAPLNFYIFKFKINHNLKKKKLLYFCIIIIYLF